MAKKQDLSKLFDPSIIRQWTQEIKAAASAAMGLNQRLDESVERTQRQAKSVRESTAAMQSGQKTTIDNLNKAASSADTLEKEYQELLATQQQLNQFQLQVNRSFGQAEKIYQRHLEALKNINKADNPKEWQRRAESVRQAKAEMEKFVKVVRQNTQVTKAANNLYDITNQKLNRSRDLLKTLIVSWDRHGKAVFRNKAEANKLLKEITQLDSKLRRFDKTIGQNFRNVGNYGAAFKGMGRGMTAMAGQFGFLVLGITSATMALKEMFDAFTQVEFKLAQVKGLSEATAEQFELLENNALMLGRTTARTAADIAELQLKLTKMGFDPEQILEMTKAITQLSIAFDEDLGMTARTVAATIRAFNLEADQTDRVANALGKAFAKSSLDLERWRTAIGFVGPQAAALNVDVETTIALLGRLANAGLNASTAATALRSIFAKMSDPTTKLNRLIGFQVKNADDLLDVFQSLAEEGYAELAEAAQITDLRAQASFLTIAKGADETRKFAAMLRESGDFLEGFSETIEETAAIKIKELVSALQGLGIAFMNVFAGPLKAIVDSITWALREAGDAIDYLRERTTLFGKEFASLAEERDAATTGFVNGLIKEKRMLRSLFSELQDEQLTREAKQEVLKEINKTYGKYLPNLLTEKSDLKEIAEAYRVVNQQMILSAVLRAEEEEIAKAMKVWVTAMANRIQLERDSKKAYDQSIKSLEEYEKKMEDLRQAINLGQGDVGVMVEQLRQGDKNIESMRATTDKLKTSWEFHRDTTFDIDLILGGIRKKHDQILAIMDVKRRVIEEEQRVRKQIVGAVTVEEEKVKKILSYYQLMVDATDQYLDNLKDAQRLERATIMLEIEKQYAQGIIGYRKFLRTLSGEESRLNLKHLREQEQATADMIKVREDGLLELSGLQTTYQNTQHMLRLAQEKDLNTKSLEALADNLNDEIELRKVAGAEVVALEASLAELRLKILQAENDKKMDLQERWVKQSKQFAQQAFNELTGALMQMQMARFTERMNALKREDMAVQEFYDREIEMAGDNAKRKEALEKDRETSERDMKRRMAELDKENAIARARIDIALSMIRTYAQFGYPFGIIFAGIIGAIGELQLAAIRATPIAAYEEGTPSAKGGLALVAEKGPELMRDRKGGYTMLGKGDRPQPMLVDVPQGSQIFNAMQTKRMAEEGGIYERSLGAANRQLMDARQTEMKVIAEGAALSINSDSQSIVKAVKSLPVHETYFDERGVSRFIKKNNSRVRRLNLKNAF